MDVGERQSERRILKDAVVVVVVVAVPQPLLAACYYLPFWCPAAVWPPPPPFCPPSMRVELNLGLILRVEERSSLLSVSGDELATESVSLPPPLPPRSPPAAVELPPAVMSARESDER